MSVLFDLSKAFDYMDDDTLVRKVHRHGVAGRDFDILKANFSDGLQRVDVNGARPSMVNS